MSQALSATASAVGEFIEYWGFKSIHGRIWTLVYLSETPISTPEIVEVLGVSKGMASIGINDLLEIDLICASGTIRNGAKTYVSTQNIATVVREVLRDRELKMVSKAENKLNSLCALSKPELREQNICPQKLKELTELTSNSKQIITKLASEDFKTITSWSSYLRRALKFLT